MTSLDNPLQTGHFLATQPYRTAVSAAEFYHVHRPHNNHDAARVLTDKGSRNTHVFPG